MQIETKYDIGQTVYFKEDRRIFTLTIKEVRILVSRKEIEICYFGAYRTTSKNEFNTTKNEAELTINKNQIQSEIIQDILTD